MGLSIMLILAYGPLDWTFPGAVWVFVTLFGGMAVYNTVNNKGAE